ncbi:Septum formation inhibitor Maf [Paragonimus heterotremus]|uniref:Septum formation inhibitor Maf n=1 Tax=Paragonimus heterotremus TaxID=100268 RepID=A0A8J4SW26_9TREM|nr:Septum formation inhibitor Maf [Paragonimus heterotremus]
MLLSSSDKLSTIRVVLASSSPRRKEIMEQMGIHCSVISVPVDENLPLSLFDSITAYVEAVAKLKAQATFDSLCRSYEHCNFDLIISADTLVAFDGIVIGKPTNHEDAIATLARLSGKTHQVVTGVCIYVLVGSETQPQVICFHETTDVKLGQLDQDVIKAYVASGEPMDKAGAYGIQGLGCSLVERINGDYFNVVGLPAHKLSHYLRTVLEQFK